MNSVQDNQNLPLPCQFNTNSQNERLQKNSKEIEDSQSQIRNMLGQLSNNEQKVMSTVDRQQSAKIQRPVSFSCSQFILQKVPNTGLREFNQGSQDKDPVLQQLQSLLKNKQGSNSKLCATFAVMSQPEPSSLFETLPEHNLLPYFRQLQDPYHIEQSKKEPQQNTMSEKDKLNMSYHSSYLDMREDVTTYKVQYGQNSKDKNINVLEQVKHLPMKGCIKQTQASMGQSQNRKSNMKEQHEQISQTNQTENADETNNNQQSAYEYRGKSMEAEGLLKINDEKYHPVNFKISEKLFSIADVPIQMEQIVKIKIFPANVEIAKHSILKITTKRLSQELLIGLRKSTKYATFPLPYYTFSKIIIKKLKSLRVSNVTNWIAPIHAPSQFFIKKKQRLDQHLEYSRSKSKQKQSMRGLEKSPTKMIKKQKACQGTTNGGTQNKNVGSQIASYSLFSWQSQLTVGKARTLIHGRIYKKSKHLGKWQKRYIVINQLGIFSFHSHTDKCPSVKIERAKIKYLWTWFSLVAQFKGPKQKSKSIFTSKTILDCEQADQNMKAVEFNEKQIDKDIQVRQILSKSSKYLVVKLKHGFSQQTQFGIPICNFDAEPINKNWLYSFYKILPQTAPLLQKK